MPAPWIHVFKDTVTASGVDGTQVSEGTGISPVIFGPLNATNNEESAAQKLAIRCDSGYQTSGSTTIALTGTTSLKFSYALDNGGVAGAWTAYGATLTIASTITATNTIFWAKAKSSSDEIPSNDASVKFQVNSIIAAA